MSPPRLMSPRPINEGGNSNRSPKIGRSTSTYLPDAMLPSKTTSQSGPMLVIDGELHPRFLPSSDSRYVRNGVGVSDDGRTAWFAISDQAVTFHEFGRFFRDGLGARDALYFDGSISRLYAPELGRADWGRSLGPIIGIVAEAAP